MYFALNLSRPFVRYVVSDVFIYVGRSLVLYLCIVVARVCFYLVISVVVSFARSLCRYFFNCFIRSFFMLFSLPSVLSSFSWLVCYVVI